MRVAAVVPEVAIANPMANAENIISMWPALTARGVRLAVFPELCVTGYTCADLFHQQSLLAVSDAAVERIAQATNGLGMAVIVGAPVRCGDALLNCGILIADGRVVMSVPKSYLPNYNEFYERRWFRSGRGVSGEAFGAPLGVGLLADVDGVKVGIEICEDLWTPAPPSSRAAMEGAEVIANLSASDDIIGKYAYLRSLILQQSARCISGYV